MLTKSPGSTPQFHAVTSRGVDKIHLLAQPVYCLQGNLKGGSVVVVILPSHMEVSYCASGFYRS